MKNWEKYEEEIKAIGIDDFAITEDGEVNECLSINCNECEFQRLRRKCNEIRVKWLYEEYKEPTLTSKEKTFIDMLRYGYMARDKNGDLFLYSTKPNRDVDAYIVIDSRGNSIGYNAIDAAYFKFIRWEDEKIWSIRELKELKVEGNERD